ncbi:flavohemoglobin expression-modulating QEGLA motif protein [Marinicella litoralis]|uniref:Uncharacterized protein (TIGR02421 family) n=1 Tax=Marinicella litoralis TaxID=644220 RepID=A0A4R6XQB6_9GAMM|nr:flavohemoglobin expression-modulating QEGLA motif protein [Marinicella litoralis]TDR20390.1 uncharacterized protein (TIGR02421 family) [Marinicella litoralis]
MLDKNNIIKINSLLYQATKPIRILAHISWPESVKEEFFRQKAQALPHVEYPTFNPTDVFAALTEARRHMQGTCVVNDWFQRTADNIENTAHLLMACGTDAFYTYSSRLYGSPLDTLVDQKSTSLDLAKQIDSLIGTFCKIDLGAPEPACFLAETVAADMKKAVLDIFGDDAPEILVVDELSANALASAKQIRIRRNACFTDKDTRQLINHEAYIHVATSLNGMAQTDLPILQAGHPGTTKTQEGLAVFAEFITGSMDIDRLQRLADRVLAIQMAVEGADFLEVYQYFLTRIGNQEQAYENARRVFRGGVLTGGAPFTKDIVYLEGLMRVHNFLRAIVVNGRTDCLRLLFCGKLDIEDIPVLHHLSAIGLCQTPKYLPPWAKDLRFLLSYLAYTSFLNQIDFAQVKLHYEDMLKGLD